MADHRKLKVFLCHSKDDKPKVRELYRRLGVDGFDVWLDEEKLLPGQDWDFEIRKAVRESDVVVVCLSSSSVTKAGYVQKEIRLALDVADEQPEGATFIIPARLEECTAPTRLSKWQWVDLFTDRGYERLQKALLDQVDKSGKGVEPVSFLQNRSANILEPQMVRIPAGKFLMGSTREQVARAIKDGVDKSWARAETPQHIVELSEYFIGKYPVTNLEYQAFVREAKYMPRGWEGERFSTEKEDHPVVNVSWSDAEAYCQWLSGKTGKPYSLPTEAEWEKAARSEDGRLYPWGNRFSLQRANTVETKLGGTSEVGQFSPQGDSPYGCADMTGNVWEWCSDWFDEHEYRNRIGQSAKDPQGPRLGEARVLRGGSFYFNRAHARCALRYWHYPNHVLRSMVGFRVCISPSRQRLINSE